LVEVSSDFFLAPSAKPSRAQHGRHPLFGGVYVSKNKQTQQAALQKSPVVAAVKPLRVKNIALREKRSIVVSKAPSPTAVKIILRDFAKNILCACYNGPVLLLL
jgi:hypothetical protein